MLINSNRLEDSIIEYGQIGKVGETGVERIALSDEDRAARDLLVSQMIAAGMEVHFDQIGNIIGIRAGKKDVPAVAIGSHLDTVYKGGRYDGALGVLAGMEVIHTLNDNGVETEKPIAVINFTNEEGVRFAPDMMGSHVYAGLADLDKTLASPAYDNPEETVGSRLKEIAYDGKTEVGSIPFDSYFELHIEQGPVLEKEQVEIGVVEMVQGIHWTKYTLKGQANHAGTTPNRYRRDAGYLASEFIKYVGDLSRQSEGSVLTTVGTISFEPNAINIVPDQVTFTLDLRSTNAVLLKQTQEKIDSFFEQRCDESEIEIHAEELVRFASVHFPQEMTDLVEQSAESMGYKTMRMPSGAGHDAQMMASFCPSTMIFVPSVNGVSHNVEEFTRDQDVENGANVLLKTVLAKAGVV